MKNQAETNDRSRPISVNWSVYIVDMPILVDKLMSMIGIDPFLLYLTLFCSATWIWLLWLLIGLNWISGREELASARRVASAIWDVIQTVKRAAIEWAIQRMEVVRIDEKSRSESCAICLEGFGEDEEETRRTACSHVFHGRCVADWLRIKNLCPLCRFQLWGDWRW